MRTSSSQAEGAEREFQAATLGIEGKKGRVSGVRCARVDERRQPIAGTEFILKADLVFLAIGFAGPVEAGCWRIAASRSTGAATWSPTTRYRTSSDKVFVAGDMRRGQSLVVWAIREGRQAARAIDSTGSTGRKQPYSMRRSCDRRLAELLKRRPAEIVGPAGPRAGHDPAQGALDP